MIHSMTGYGRAEKLQNNYEILVEIKSVNHRFFELNQRIPRTYGYLEQKVKELCKNKVSRGKVEVSIQIHPLEKEESISVNRSVVQGYLQVLRSVGKEFQVPDDLHLSAISSLPDVFSVFAEEKEPSQICEMVLPVVEEALSQFVSSREKEGLSLRDDLLEKLSYFNELLLKVKKKAPSLEIEYRERLQKKLELILADMDIDESRILTEAALFADKSAIDEEIVRLFSHKKQFESILCDGGAVGKKCDFMIQEMNREVNTIGSKISDLQVTQLVIELKSTLEMIREQIQNVE